MAAKPLDHDIAEQVVADWRTGEYSQQDLADRHHVSKGVVNKLCKGVPQDTAAIVTAGIQYRTGLAAHDDRNVTAVTEVVDRKVARLEYLNDAAILNVRQAMDAVCEDQQDFRHRANTIKHAVEVIDPRNGVAVQINNSNQVVEGSARELIETRLARLTDLA